jgi:hypothetical protein
MRSRTLPLEMDGLHLAATMPAPRHPLRSYIIGLFRHGDLISVHEATLICDASRQAITKWLKAEGLNVEARRLAYLAKLRTNAERYLNGLPPTRKPTKRQMRRDLEKAIRRFNKANATQLEEQRPGDSGCETPLERDPGMDIDL